MMPPVQSAAPLSSTSSAPNPCSDVPMAIPSRMLKKSASFVLARHCRLTISAAFTNVTRFIQRVVNLRGSSTAMGKEPVSAGSGRAGEMYTIRPPRHCRLTASPASANVRHWALTGSRPFTDLTCIILHVVNLIVLRVADLAAAEPRSGVSRHAGVGRVRQRAILNILRSYFSSCATFQQAISSRRKIVFQQPARHSGDTRSIGHSQPQRAIPPARLAQFLLVPAKDRSVPRVLHRRRMSIDSACDRG